MALDKTHLAKFKLLVQHSESPFAKHNWQQQQPFLIKMTTLDSFKHAMVCITTDH